MIYFGIIIKRGSKFKRGCFIFPNVANAMENSLTGQSNTLAADMNQLEEELSEKLVVYVMENRVFIFR